VLEKLGVIIAAAAAIIMTIVCIGMKFPLVNSIIIICVTIVVFFIIGAAIQFVARSFLFKRDENKNGKPEDEIKNNESQSGQAAGNPGGVSGAESIDEKNNIIKDTDNTDMTDGEYDAVEK